MKKTTLALSALGVICLSLGACSQSPTTDSSTQPSTQAQTQADPGEAGFDLSSIKADPEVSALVPETLKQAGVLRVGSSTDYPPAEYRKEDGQTATGYEVDIVKAVAKVMGIKDAEVTHNDFDSLLPQIGTKFDIGASSFTITADRLQQVNMISFAKVGFAYGVQKGNPKNFTPEDVCGKIIGVQTGTAQLDMVTEYSEKCVADGKKPIEIKPHKNQAEITGKVISGQYDATLADSPVVGYAVALSNGQLEKAGEAFDTAEHGIVVAKKDLDLSKAVEAALNKLITNGDMKKIFDHYGSGDAVLDAAVLNPKTQG